MWNARDAKAGDLEQLTGLLTQLYTIEPQFTPHPENQKKGLALCLERPELCRIVVIEREGEVVGMANVQFAVSTANGAISSHIDDFIIDQRRRGQGAGKALMAAAMETAREAGSVRMTVNIDISNEPGLSFYRAMGYTSMNLMKHQLFLESELDK